MLHTLFILLHIGGAILGAGGAFVSDMLFFRSIRDRQISTSEITSLLRGSKVVWTGIAILILSGILLFLEDPSKYLHSSKFLAKMTIVSIITANGLVFQRIHIPYLRQYTDQDLPVSLVVSGALSGVSWVSALLLGLAKNVPYSYGTIMTVYIAAVLSAMAIALTFRRYLFSSTRNIPPNGGTAGAGGFSQKI